jgi:RNA polymerase sigma factor (TIGR02999 family)
LRKTRGKLIAALFFALVQWTEKNLSLAINSHWILRNLERRVDSKALSKFHNTDVLGYTILVLFCMASAHGHVTELLRRWSQGDTEALNLLMPLVYEDLRRLASYYLQQEGNAQTLQSTALVHEVYLRLCHQQDPQWDGRAHFFAVAAKMIRRILVDHARRRSAGKRGRGIQPDLLDEALMLPVPATLDLLALDESLKQLAEFDERKCHVVEMRFFTGLSAKDIATVLHTTEATVRRDWNIARAWLYRRLQGEDAS